MAGIYVDSKNVQHRVEDMASRHIVMAQRKALGKLEGIKKRIADQGFTSALQERTLVFLEQNLAALNPEISKRNISYEFFYGNNDE